MATTAPPLRRIQSLDVVRGVAVMGILTMNIVAFSMPMAAYMNPAAFGGTTGADLWAYLINFVLFDGKMRGLFSFLFGASTLLVIERATAREVNPARVHYSRMFWLLLFGLAHLYLLWWGDILALYALVGLLLWFFRKLRVSRLIIVGVLLLLVQCLIVALIPLSVQGYKSGAFTGGDMAAAAEGLRALREGFGVPPADAINEQLALYRGSYGAILANRFELFALGPINALFVMGAETLAYMLFGMAAFKTGMLSGAWARSSYWKWVAIGFGIGIPAYAMLGWYMVDQDFSMFSVTVAVMALPTLFRPVMILGWAALIILLMRDGWLTQRIAAAGRMAFTNYLMTTILCTTFFYGYGLGWFGYLSRAEIYVVVAVVWLLMLLWSKPWLERFRYGPFEWLWRSLSRARLQPLRGSALRHDPAAGRVASATQ
ncbi:DUF418 domain-containing protein [Sphingosinithalassobacter sp. CS137]|uniref:DUF418 domain-containing protein n=1 Tax=Sphingosinithalassobacter sp. CS137 TaxID=2762748 RepID=UPI00165E14B6|nr:DUF418 domain-containing protein [Sphingosinithalassobacter sp. CS137]